MSKHKKPKDWHEYVPGYQMEFSNNDMCQICHGFRSWACHNKCLDCGNYNIYLVCGCGKSFCKKHSNSHWCKTRDKEYFGDRKMKCGTPMRL